MINHALGLVSVSFRQNSPEEILAAMKQTKLTCIEWGSDVHAPCRDEKRLVGLVKLQQEYGINCCSYGTYFRLGINDLSELESYAAAAEILGTKTLRIWCGDKSAPMYSESERKMFLEIVQKAAEIAEKLDVVLCMECHNNTYTQTLEGALELMNTADSKNFRMYWQPNQFVDFDINAEYVKRISCYVENVHVFNWDGDNKYPLEDAVDVWKRYVSFFETPKTLLLEFMPDGRIESLASQAESLCRIVR